MHTWEGQKKSFTAHSAWPIDYSTIVASQMYTEAIFQRNQAE